MKRLLLLLLPLILCGAASFNGSSQGASTTASLSYGTNAVTVSYWVRFTGTTGARVIFESSSAYTGGTGRFIATYNDPSDGREAWAFRGATYRLEHTGSAAATNEWTHRVAVYSGGTFAGDVVVYINGFPATLTVVNASANFSGNFTDQRLYVGSRAESSLRLQSEIQDLAIYAGAVSAAEAYSLGAQRMSPLKVRSAKLLYYWPFSAGENPSNSPDLVGGIPVNSGTKSITTSQAPTFRK